MKNWYKNHTALVIIVALFVIIRIIGLTHPLTVFWDAAVYTGMGKYLFSHGAIGTWEVLRPVALPIILGFFWKIGISPYVVGTIFSLIVSAALVVLVYFFAEEMRKGSGPIAAVLLAGSGIFFAYSAVPVTDITSTFFAALSIWLTYKAQRNTQFLVAGLITAVAFMFRFPQGLLLVVNILSVIIYTLREKKKKGSWNQQIVTMIERVFLVGAGFCIIAVPFLIVNYHFYHNPFLPFIEGTAGITGYPSLYQKGIWFYFVQFLREDFLYLFMLVPIALLWKKEYRSKVITPLLIALVIVGGYFIIYQTHKEFRYGLSFLPYMVVLTGVGVAYVLDYFKLPHYLLFTLLVIVAFMSNAGAISHVYQNPDTVTMHKFDSYFLDKPGARMLATQPTSFAFSDVKLTHNLYGNWEDAYYAYTTYKQDNDYISLNSCNLEIGCADDAHCKDDKTTLLAALQKNDTEVFSATTSNQCSLLIYKINH